jgi:hypothetical protein
MRRSVLLAAMLAILCGPASAGSVMRGPGIETCAQFAKHYASDPQEAEKLFTVWTLGYLSGQNVFMDIAADNYQDLSGIDIPTMQGDIRLYCDQHPLEPFTAAIVSATKQLKTITTGKGTTGESKQ